MPRMSEQISSQEGRDADTRLKINPALEVDAQPKLTGLDAVEVTVVKTHLGLASWNLTSIVLAFGLGVLAHFIAATANGSVRSLGENSKIVLFSLATLCLGFGAATLINWRIRDAQWRAVKVGYETLDAKAKELVKEIAQRKDRAGSQPS